MKKLLMLFVLCGLISDQAWGSAGSFTLGGKTYKCGKTSGANLQEYTKYQTVGKVVLYYGKNKSDFISPGIHCYEYSMTKEDDRKWCVTSEFKKVDLPGVRYCLVSDSQPDNTQHCVDDGPRKNEGHAKKWDDVCIRGYCREDYVRLNDEGCLPMSTVASCTPSNMEHNDGEKLSTSGNNFVYCITKADLKKVKLKSDAVNYCLPGTMYRDKDNPLAYHLCNEAGKWNEGEYIKCKAGDQCKNGDDGCELMAFDISDQQTKIKLRATGQTVVSGNKDSICVRWMCNKSTHVKSGNKCITIEKHKANVAIANKNKKACEGSGGTWASNKCTCNAQNVESSGNLCVCISGYRWNDDKKQGCILTDTETLKRACNRAPAGTAKWNDDTKECLCNDNDQSFDVSRAECFDNQDYAACKPLVTRGVATWNSGAKECVCNQRGYIIENNDCVESPEAAAERQERERAEALRVSRRKISDAHGILVGMRETFKASVWKDEEGKFNTSRLVSDSVAGVVLGTVGGVITSNVVKKNQVENGFEDIKCTIGGQTVADWGDEFRVGIQ